MQNDAELRAALASAGPGTRILIASGTYSGGIFVSDLRGSKEKPIIIEGTDPARPPEFIKGSNGIQLSNPSFVELRHLAFSDMDGNGINIDDGKAPGSAGNVILENLFISKIGPEGNKDGIKLSGLSDFEVRNCRVEFWGTGGSGIDMVGCHRGLIEGNIFRHTQTAGGSGVQCKGGSSKIVIRKNHFENAGNRSVNIGGSTGLQFFRPPLKAGAPQAEARDILVEGNTFVGSASPIAFVGVDGAIVRFNTIYKPGRWALRILQETKADGFVPCRNGEFSDNLIVFISNQWASGGVNVGGGTAPETFIFSRNWWFCLDQPERSDPALPTPETEGIRGKDPQLRDAEKGDLRVKEGGPASKIGAMNLPSISSPGD